MTRFRRTTRHKLALRGAATHGTAVALDAFRQIGDRFLDASAEGVLVACDREVALGDRVLVSFAVPGSDLVFDAETEVSRIVEGFRPLDPGYCAGLRYTYFDRRDRLALGMDLRALPPIPRSIRWGHRPAGALPTPPPPPSVVMRSIVRIGR
jgi:hypothetical protein